MLGQIKYKKLENKINLIILSDHGMDTVTYDRIIFLDDYVSNMTYKSIITGPNAFILPNIGKPIKNKKYILYITIILKTRKIVFRKI